MTSITRVIKDLIDANTIAGIQEDLANGSVTVGITNVIYTDENFANTANDYIANTSSHGYIKVLGYGFLPNSNVVLSFPKENDHVFIDYANTYYVNFKEIRAQIENSKNLASNLIELTNTILSPNTYFNLFVINENATNSKINFGIKIESKSVFFGWFGGGFVASVQSTVDRIDFADDTVTASVRGPLSSARSGSAATGNNNYGWFGGGGNPPAISLVDRITFTDDTVTTSVRGPLSLNKFNPAVTSNDNYGWFGGGSADNPTLPISTTDRINFSDDTVTTSVRGPLSLARFEHSATGNDNYGWFAGGKVTATNNSRVDRIDFSFDTTTASVRGPLSSARSRSAATGNNNYGWFGGGNSPSLSTVDRITFADDTVTASVRGPLSGNKSFTAATSNLYYGWFGGGTPGTLSTVERIDFSDDTVTTSVRGTLSAGRYALASTSGLS